MQAFSRDQRVRAVLEVLGIFVLLLGASRIFDALPAGKWIGYGCVAVVFAAFIACVLKKNDFLRYGIPQEPGNGSRTAVLVFIFSMLFLALGGIWVAVILLLLCITGRDFTGYGITMHSLKSDLKIVALCIVPVMAVDYAALTLNTGSLQGTLIFSGLIVILLVIILFLVKDVPCRNDTIRIRAGIIIPAIIAVSAVSLASIMTAPDAYKITGIADYLALAVNGLVFGFVLQAIPQQILFRGYIQSRLNDAFGRPYTFFGISWGAGLIIAALLFGLLHAVNMVNPFAGKFGITPLWGVWTFFFGLVYGFLREKTGSITAPAIIHGIEDTFSYLVWFG